MSGAPMSEQRIEFTLRGLVGAALRTLQAPRAMAEDVLAERLPGAVLWAMLTAVVAVSVVLGQGSLLLAEGETVDNPYLGNPFALFALQMGILAVMVAATHHIGRFMGGMGSFEGALALVTWLQFVLVCLQVVQTLAMFVAPPIADLIGIAGIVLFLWLFTNFVAVLHGFPSLGLVFVMILLSAFGLTFLISLLLTMLGLTPGDMNV